jgi:hypothetical protein
MTDALDIPAIEVEQRFAVEIIGRCAESSGQMSMPSNLAGGSGAPQSFAMVGKRSMVEAIPSLVLPRLIRPGQRARNGTRTPPSQVIPLRPRSLPGLPWNQGPLSEVKMTSVLESCPVRFSALNNSPMLQSSSSMTSP